MESSPPLLLRNMITTIFLYADKSFLNLSQKHKLLQLLRYLLISTFLFFLRLLPHFFPPSLKPSTLQPYNYPSTKPHNLTDKTHVPNTGSGISRALSQLLSIVNDLPVSSRKYEVARSLAEKVIDENICEGSQTLLEINCIALSAAFSKTLGQLESAVIRQGYGGGGGDGSGDYHFSYRLNQVFGAVRYCGGVMWRLAGRWSEELSWTGSSAEKLAAELLWLSQNMAACGCADEAVMKWGSASKLAWLALSAEPRLQTYFVKVSAFLLKQARTMGNEEDKQSKKEQQRQTKLRMLMSWLPLLCRSSSATDAPVLSINEKTELERVLEDIIGALKQEEEQEMVLSLWLHHFTHCPSSDWPNLRPCYNRWCTASRKLLLVRPRLRASQLISEP